MVELEFCGESKLISAVSIDNVYKQRGEHYRFIDELNVDSTVYEIHNI